MSDDDTRDPQFHQDDRPLDPPATIYIWRMPEQVWPEHPDVDLITVIDQAGTHTHGPLEDYGSEVLRRTGETFAVESMIRVLGPLDREHRDRVMEETRPSTPPTDAQGTALGYPAYPCPDDPDGLHHVGCGCSFYGDPGE